MNDMSSTIIAKSDQINAADLVGISRTITVKEVRIKAGDDQPVTIMIEGDKKAFRPCKGVRRLLVRVWGADANKYIGQSLTIYCDPTVTWAGKPEGGIRVSHMTGLDEKIVEYMRTSREKTKPYEILPLVMQKATASGDFADELAQLKASAAPGQSATLKRAWDAIGPKARKALASELPALKALCEQPPADDVPFDPTTDEITEPDDATDQRQVEDNPNVNDVHAKWIKAVGEAADEAAVARLDKGSEMDRGFFTQEQRDQLDQALAGRRETLRTEQFPAMVAA